MKNMSGNGMWRPCRSALMMVLATGVFGGADALRAQQAEEPALEALRRTFQRPELTMGFLLQAVVDPGIDGQEASSQVAAARLRLTGRLDGGFNYLLQTNFAASPSLLDARVGWSRDARFGINAGRFKAPFSRELLTYAGSIDFVNRARVVSQLSPARQVGVQVNGVAGGHLGWSVGGFTGPRSQTVNSALVGVGRLEGRALAVGGGTLSVAGHLGVGRDAAVAGRALPTSFQGDGVLWGFDARFEADAVLLSAEVIRADWDPTAQAEVSAQGHYLTLGYTLPSGHQALVRWDRYRAIAGENDDQLVLGYNIWPTGASEIQVNWLIPVNGSATPHQLLVNFQVGI